MGASAELDIPERARRPGHEDYGRFMNRQGGMNVEFIHVLHITKRYLVPVTESFALHGFPLISVALDKKRFTRAHSPLSFSLYLIVACLRLTLTLRSEKSGH